MYHGAPWPNLCHVMFYPSPCLKMFKVGVRLAKAAGEEEGVWRCSV